MTAKFWFGVGWLRQMYEYAYLHYAGIAYGGFGIFFKKRKSA